MTAPVYTDFSGIAQLRGAAQRDGQAVLREVAGQFEALFVQMMLKSMREASMGDALFDSSSMEQYRDMLDAQLSVSLSRRNGIGLAEVLVRQLGGESTVTPSSPPNAALAAAGARQPRPPAPVAAPTIGAAPGAEFESPEQFTRSLWPHARRAAAALGVEPVVLIAQAALETGWGQAVIRHGDGRSSNNLFNIKADHRWQGASVGKATVEFVDGVAARQHHVFRSYGSIAESFADYVDFLRTSPRYQAALAEAADGPRFLRALQDAGYATDPEYAGKIEAILERPLLRGFGAEFKLAPGRPLSTT